MTGWQLIAAAALYAWAALDYGIAGRWSMAGAFICYAVANVCFALDAR